MNFCTKCECHFTQPGTCNCFAPKPVTFMSSSATPLPRENAVPLSPQLGGGWLIMRQTTSGPAAPIVPVNVPALITHPVHPYPQEWYAANTTLTTS